MQLDLMIEGQEGVTWPQWLDIAHACEQHGITTLFRSDHYMNLDGLDPQRPALDALGTSIALGAVTTKLRFGTMVSPATFRHPSVLAKLAVTADHVSGGRFELGLGAGWHEREHAAYGFPYYDLKTRMDRFAEQLEIIHGTWMQSPFTFNGEHYQLDALDAQPRPVQQPHLPLLMGGNAGPRAAALAARFADEYNTTAAAPEAVRERKAAIDAACERTDRAPIPFSVMTPIIVGTDEADLLGRARAAARFRRMPEDSLDSEAPPGWLRGTVEQVAEQIRTLADVGVSRVLCQHLPHYDLETIEIIGTLLAPLVA